MTTPTALTTNVAIIGAGPAGLLLGVALQRAGIGFVIIENRSREYVLSRIRAGVLEQGSVETLTRLGVGDRLAREGLVHDGIYLQFAGERHHVDFNELIGRTVTVYGQQEVVKDLCADHDANGSAVYYDAAEVTPHGLDGHDADRHLRTRRHLLRARRRLRRSGPTGSTASRDRASRRANSPSTSASIPTPGSAFSPTSRRRPTS